MRSFFALLALLTWGQANAAQIYLLFEPACGELIRYSRTVEDVSRMDYYAYSLPAGFGVRMLLETDAAGANVRNRLPDEVLSCGSFTVTEEQASRVNDGVDQLFLLSALPEGGYRQQPVLMAAVLEEMNGNVRYRSPFAAFSFDPENSVIGVDLTTDDETSRVYFEGQQGKDCLASYLLRQENSGTAYPSINYRIVPDLGIVERNLAGDGRFSDGETIVATEVNGKPLDQFLDENCARAEPATTFVPLYIEPVAPETETPATVSTSPESKTVAPEPSERLPAAPARTIHTVARGETLYAISRRYGVSVPEIKLANGLIDNTIRVGQELTIGSDDGYSAAATPSYTPPVAEPAVTQPVVAPAPPAAEEVYVSIPPSRPETDEETYVPPTVPTPSSPVATTSAVADFHVVQPGETLASLARKYGYTTERFKEFNGLENAQVALVGQRLRTSHCSCPPAGDRQIPVPAEQYPTVPAYTESYPTSRPVMPPSPYRPLEPETESSETEPTPTAATPPAYGAPLQQGRAFHTVKDGESLYGIARQYRMTVAELQELNDLRPADVIVPFQKLYVN